MKNTCQGLLILLVVLLGTFGPGCGKKAAKPSEPPKTPAAVAEFLGRYDLTGRVALLEFGEIGCEKSEEGLNKMINLHRRDLIPGLSYVRIERSDDSEVMESYYAEKKPGFPVHHDPESSLSRSFGATAYPSFVLVGKFGRIRYRGSFPEDHLSEWSETLVAEKTDPGPDVRLFGVAELNIRELLATTELPSTRDNKTLPLGFYAGKGGLMVMFVDISCPFVAKAVGDLPDVAAELDRHGMKTVLVNVDDGATETVNFYQNRPQPVPVVYDSSTDTRLQWGVSSVPTVFVLAADNALYYNGSAVWDVVARSAEKALQLKTGELDFSAPGTEYG